MAFDEGIHEAEDDAAIRAEQVAKLAGQEMGPHELAAYYSGFPPGLKCVATPEIFRQGLENGDIEIAVAPTSLAAEALEACVGPQESLGLGGAFKAANADATIMPEPAPDLTRTV